MNPPVPPTIIFGTFAEERKTLGLLPGERAGGGFDPRAPSRTGARFQDFEGAKFRREAQAFEEFKRQQGQKVSISGQQEITPFPDTQELIKPEETILPEVQAQKEAEKVGLGDQILRIINLPLELFVKDTAAVIPVTAGEEGTAEFDPEKALKLTRRVVTGAAIGNFGILNKFLSGLPGSVKQIVIGIIGASGLTQWLAVDNIFAASSTAFCSGLDSIFPTLATPSRSATALSKSICTISASAFSFCSLSLAIVSQFSSTPSFLFSSLKT